MIQHLDAIVYKSLDEALGHNDSTQVVMGIGSELKELQKNIKEKKEQLTKASRKVKHERPTGWLQEYLSRELDRHGFLVDTEGMIVKPIAPVSEYVSSHSDLLIFHSSNFATKFNALYVQVHYPMLDVLCVGDPKEQLIDEIRVAGFISEFKMEEAKGDVENECFHSMFGQGVNLAMMEIEKGKIVSCLNIYGIVVAAATPDEARLLEIELNFKHKKCVFKRVVKHYKLVSLLNMVLEHLCIHSSLNHTTTHTRIYTIHKLHIQYVGTTRDTLHTPVENVGTHNLHRANYLIVYISDAPIPIFLSISAQTTFYRMAS